MKILICPDSFKGTLTSLEASMIISNGIKEIKNDIETVLLPIADGGEGTLDSLANVIKLNKIELDVLDPLGRKINTYYAKYKDTAIIEMAKSSGLTLLKESERNALNTSSFGLGMMINNAIDLGFTKIMIFIGGSATNDCGLGMAQALGVNFLNSNNEIISNDKPLCPIDIKRIEKINMTSIKDRLKGIKFTVCTDVKNALLGVNGATYIYGKQKGLQKSEIIIAENMMKKFSDLILKYLHKDITRLEGGGAAGGVGAGLNAFLNAKISSGLEIIAKLVKLEKQIKECDIVITGEGCMDKQSSFGKATYSIAKLSNKYNKPVYALNGFLESNPGMFSGVYGTNSLPEFDKKNYKQNAKKLLKKLSIEFTLKEL